MQGRLNTIYINFHGGILVESEDYTFTGVYHTPDDTLQKLRGVIFKLWRFEKKLIVTVGLEQAAKQLRLLKTDEITTL